MTKLSFVNVLVLSALLLAPCASSAEPAPGDETPQTAATATQAARDQQTNVPPEVRQAEQAVERTVRRFRIGVEGGVGLDPEVIVFGAHGTFGPIFSRNVEFRPGFEIGAGEITTFFAINLDVLYTLPGAVGSARWTPYIGAGPNIGVSHRGFDTEGEDEVEERNRFDFGDTDFDAGFNIIAGVGNPNGVFLEMKATPYGVTNVRLLVGFNF